MGQQHGGSHKADVEDPDLPIRGDLFSFLCRPDILSSPLHIQGSHRYRSAGQPCRYPPCRAPRPVVHVFFNVWSLQSMSKCCAYLKHHLKASANHQKSIEEINAMLMEREADLDVQQ